MKETTSVPNMTSRQRMLAAMRNTVPDRVWNCYIEGGIEALAFAEMDTPDANIREMVRVAHEFGTYPLDLAAIDRELAVLSRHA